jgi:hypothetical protein
MELPGGIEAHICGAHRQDGLLCSYEPLHPGGHSWEVEALKEALSKRQPRPSPGEGQSVHDLVIKDILSRDPRWDLSVGSARHIRDRVANDLEGRKQFGLVKYGTTLQAYNGRDALLDAYDELLDAACYARQRLLETSPASVEYLLLFETYDDIVSHLPRLRRLMDAATE